MILSQAQQIALQKKFSEYIFYFHESIDSTQKECARLWEKSPLQRCVVIANQQTQGHGRYGRNWQSPKDKNIYISWIQPNYLGKQIGLLNLLCGILVYQTIQTLHGDVLPELTLKWPNDVYVGSKKLAGILLQSLDVDFANIIIGIGINVLAESADIPDIATSLYLETRSQNIQAGDILSLLLQNFAQSSTYTVDQIISEFSQFSQKSRIYPYTYSCYQYYHVGRLSDIHKDGTATIYLQNGKTVHLNN